MGALWNDGPSPNPEQVDYYQLGMKGGGEVNGRTLTKQDVLPLPFLSRGPPGTVSRCRFAVAVFLQDVAGRASRHLEVRCTSTCLRRFCRAGLLAAGRGGEKGDP